MKHLVLVVAMLVLLGAAAPIKVTISHEPNFRTAPWTAIAHIGDRTFTGSGQNEHEALKQLTENIKANRFYGHDIKTYEKHITVPQGQPVRGEY